MKTAARFDITNTLPPMLRRLGISSNLFGKYCSVGSSDICSMLSGTKRISSERAVKFGKMVADLELVARAFAPARVRFDNVEETKALIRRLRDGSLVMARHENGTTTITPDLSEAWKNF